MKKLFLIAALLFVSYGVFANDFDNVVKLEQVQAEKAGYKVRGDKAYNVMFYDIKLPADVTSVSREDIEVTKQQFVSAYKRNAGAAGIALLKKLNITLIVNLIKTDYTIYSFVVTADEL